MSRGLGDVYKRQVFKLHTCWNVEPPFSTNNTQWTGGVWMPLDGPLEENKHWLLVLKNTVYAAEHLPVCFSVLINTLCFPLKEQLYAADKEQHSDYYQLSMVATVGLRAHEGVYHTVNPPPVPPCALDTDYNGSVFWSLCRGPNATIAFLPKSPFVVQNWGANWRILAKPDTTTVLAQPQKLYTKMW